MDNPQPASMVQFDFSGRVELRIRPNNQMIHKVKIRPLSKGIEYTVRENMIYFSLDKPGKFSIEINENRVNNLHVFANEPETEVPNQMILEWSILLPDFTVQKICREMHLLYLPILLFI